jgi:aspartate/methionine/tyrosine aminotransferase
MPTRTTSTTRLASITGIGLDAVAAAAGTASDILRLENLDTDLPVPEAAVREGSISLTADDNNSWLPLTGRYELREAIAQRLKVQTGHEYSASDQIVITCGGMEGLLDALLATTDPGEEVVITDPTYAGMINRVRLVGAVPVFVPFRRSGPDGLEWRLDLDRLWNSIAERTRALFIMNPSMPSGAVLNAAEWQVIAQICSERDLWLIYNAAMERILYDDRPYFHPASLPGMAERTLTVGSASKELRMIGWKVGWVAGPREIMQQVAKAHIYNTACPVGIAQTAVARALQDASAGVVECVKEWEKRRDAIVSALSSKYEVIPAAGGWSMLLDVAALGMSSSEASRRLLERGRIAATYMRDWGRENSDQYVRLVFSNEPVPRLVDIRERFDRAFLDR